MDKWILSFTQSLVQFFKAEMAGMHVFGGVSGIFDQRMSHFTHRPPRST